MKRLLTLAGVMLLALLTLGCQSEYQYKGSVLDPPMTVSEFELTDTNQQPFNLDDIKGDLGLVFFGYTYCPDICPMTMFDVAQALDGLENRDRVHVIFVSVDPERDTTEQTARYVSSFDDSFIGLTDDWEATRAAMRDFGAYAEKEEVTDSQAGYLVNHTARVYLINPEGNIAMTYGFGFEPEDLRSDLEHLLQNLEG